MYSPATTIEVRGRRGPRDRKAFFVVVFKDGFDERFCTFAAATPKAVGLRGPSAVVATLAKNADFFPCSDQRLPPTIRQWCDQNSSATRCASPKPKVRVGFGIFLMLLDGDGVVGRNAVPTARIFVVDIDSNHPAQRLVSWALFQGSPADHHLQTTHRACHQAKEQG